MTAQKPRVLRVTVHTVVFRAALGFSGMSHAQLALKAGVSKAEVGMLASGKRTTCKASTAGKIANALELEKARMEFHQLFEVKVFMDAPKVAA